MKRLVFIVLHVLILVTGCEDKNYTSSLSVSITENRLICCHTAVVTDKQVVLCVRFYFLFM